MSSETKPNPAQHVRRVFSAVWSEELRAAIISAAPARGYPMSLAGEDAQAAVEAVNQGIDASLEACFVPERGDRYACGFRQLGGEPRGPARLEAMVSPESLAVMVRRLLESSHTAAASLAAGICQTLAIELV